MRIFLQFCGPCHCQSNIQIPGRECLICLNLRSCIQKEMVKAGLSIQVWSDILDFSLTWLQFCCTPVWDGGALHWFGVGKPLHYRLRGSIGLLNVQKVSKSRRLFLTDGTSKTDKFALFVKIMTQILCKIIFSQGWQSETGQKSDKCLEKPEGGLRRS